MTNALVGFAILLASQAEAKIVQNSYIRFDLPENWVCAQENVAWICSPTGAAESREALIVVTAKIAGPEDNLNSFSNYLKQPKSLVTKTKSSMSQPLSLARATHAGIEWIEAVHFSSEVPNFTTKYLATVKDKLALVASFSADRESLGKYDPIFNVAIRSIRIDASNPAILQAQQQSAIAEKQGSLGLGTDAPSGEVTNTQGATPPDKKRKLLEFGLIAAGSLMLLMIIRKLV